MRLGHPFSCWIFLVAFFVPAIALSQTLPPNTLPDALTKLNQGDHAGVVEILEPFATDELKDARVFRVLGVAYIRMAAYDKALDVFARSLVLQPDFPGALYNTGVVHALKGDKEKAFEWLEKAKATRMNMSGIEVDNDLVSLRDDPRFRKLLPSPEEFADPFVEKTRIIHEWDGESANDQFGWIARNIGDVDGDKVADFVTSAPTKDIGEAKQAGRVYVYSSKSGKLLWTADGKSGDQLGTGIEAAGDTNRDGVPDVVAGGAANGVAYVYSGKDGTVLHSLKGEDGDSLGPHISGVGDVDHDGYADVIVGAPASTAGGEGAGRAYVFSGKSGRRLWKLTGSAGDALGSTVAGWASGKRMFLLVGAPGAGPKKIGRVYVYDSLSQKPKFIIESDETGAALGRMFVSVLGDVDGDQVPDIYGSDWANNANARGTGRVYVHSGKTGKRILTLTGTTAGEGFGTSSSVAGDLDGDGHADLAVGSWQYAGAAPSGGRIYIHSGKTGQLIGTISGQIPGETLGFDSVGVGDVDGDGTIDLLVTSAWSAKHGYQSGRVFIVSSGIKPVAK